MTRIIGYAYEADVHCADCANDRFGDASQDHTDAEGNPIHPLFSTDEMPEDGEWCGDCGAEIAAPWWA